MTYADQGRHELAALTLTQADLCEITDPIYRNQLNGLINLYSNWDNLNAPENANRNNLVQSYLYQEHGLATDLAADITNQSILLRERWKYESLTFASPSSTKDQNDVSLKVYPNPAFNILYVSINGMEREADVRATIMNIDGKVMADVFIRKEVSEILIGELPSGIYTIKVINQNQVIFVTKFIKLK